MITDEQLKDAICNSDIQFLAENISQYDINRKFEDEDNDSLLSYSISDEKSGAYSFFLENGADLKSVNDFGETALHAAVYSGDFLKIISVLNTKKIDIDSVSNDGTTPLLLSVLLEKYEIFKLLIEFGANINISDNEKNSPLHVASSIGNYEMVLDLVNHGAKLKEKTSKGNYPIALAINSEHVNIVKFLYMKIYENKDSNFKN